MITLIDYKTGKPDYIFKNGDKVYIGFNIYQVLNDKLRRVMDFIDVEGQETFYIEPDMSFTYGIEENEGGKFR